MRRYIPWAMAFVSILTVSWLLTLAQAQVVVPPSSAAMACAYNTVPPTGTTGTFIFVQCDATGQLKVAP